MGSLLKRFSEISFYVVVSTIVVCLLFYASYVIGGFDFLVQGRWGTDMKSALSMAMWYDTYFPNVPFWYPIAGGGVSFTDSYPTFSFVLVSLLRRLTQLNIVSAFAWVGYISVPLMAIGIYSFVVLRTKRILMGVLAAFFYLISPIAWVWLSDWGFYAEAVSHIFVMPAIIFWDMYIVSVFEKDTSKIKYGSLVLTIIFTVLAYLTHYGTGYALLGFYIFYIAGYGFSKVNRRSIGPALLGFILVSVFVTTITLYRSYSFYRYSGVVATSSVGSGGNYEQIKGSTFSPIYVSGLKPSLVLTGEGDYIPNATRHISFLGIVTVLSLVGMLFCVKDKRARTFTLFALFAFFVSTNARFLYFVLLYVPSPFSIVLTWRWTFIVLRFAIPFLAAFGIVSLVDTLLFFLKGKRVALFKNSLSALISVVIVAGIAVFVGTLSKPEGLPYLVGSYGIDLRNIWDRPQQIVVRDETKSDGVLRIPVEADSCLLEATCKYLNDTECLNDFNQSDDVRWCHSPISSYFPALAVRGWCGLEAETGEVVTEVLCDPNIDPAVVRARWSECMEGSIDRVCELAFDSFWDQITKHAPEINVVQDLSTDGWFESTMESIRAVDGKARVDYSPYLSGLGMLGPNVINDTELSQIYVYTVASASLNSKYYVQYANSLFLEDPYYQRDAELVSNLTKWFGVDYLFTESHTSIDSYYDYGWKLFATNDDGAKQYIVNVLQTPETTSLAEISNKPRVLVIGDGQRGAYDDVYRISMYGMLPYDEYVIVRGETRVDDYDEDELSKFDILVLHGYSYNNLRDANQILHSYVASGGSVFIDTGWQYVTPDWEFTADKGGLSVIPFNSLKWTNLGITDDYRLTNAPFLNEIDVAGFGELNYQGESWGVSSAEVSSLSNWATPLLTVDESVLVATGEYGQGRVVWSGMNILNHIKQGTSLNSEELKLMKELFVWLGDSDEVKQSPLTYKRDNPDKVVFELPFSYDGNSILWKEGYHPDFRAYLKSNADSLELSTYRAGPSFVYIGLPDDVKGESVTYEYKVPFAIRLSQVVSILGLVLLMGGYVEIILMRDKSRVLAGLDRVKNSFMKINSLWRKPLGWLNNTDNEEEY